VQDKLISYCQSAFVRQLARIATLVCSVCCLSSPSLGVVNGVLAAANDRRLDAVGLLLYARDAACAGWGSGSCVLIAADQVLIARHSLNVSAFAPLPSLAEYPYRIRFRRSVDGEMANALVPDSDVCHGVYQEIEVVRLIDAPNAGADLVIGELARPVVGIRPIGLSLNTPLRAGQRLVLAGWGSSGTCFGQGAAFSLRSAVGLLPWNAQSQFISFTPCTLGSVEPCWRCPTGGPWIGANTWDSGGGIFIEVRSDLNDPWPELRLVASVSSTQTAMRPAAWNGAGGVPVLAESPLLTSSAKADFDRDGQRTVDDLIAYVESFLRGQAIAAILTPGATVPSSTDLFTFIGWWMAE
jgi:hypothetical protein